MKATFRLGKSDVTTDDVWRVAHGERVELEGSAKQRIAKGRQVVERLLSTKGRSFYGINTGFGSLKDVRIEPKKLQELQVNLIRSHAVGVGAELDRQTVRAMMFLRANTLTKGHSGVRAEVVEQLIAMLNADVVPVVPSQGSVGASGDLAPLAHVALAMMGEGDCRHQGKKMPASKALGAAKISSLVPEAKEALALCNGTQMMTALGLLAVRRATSALRHADIAAAMTLEAALGSPRAFDERVHQLRPHRGQGDSAANLRLLTADSEVYESHRDCHRVQDAYSIRCAPQVHGASRDVVAFVRKTLEIEANSVTDNPLIFSPELDVVSAGNFHGQPVAVALDTLALALTSTASISERRMARLLHPSLSELPAGLVDDAGLRSGLMMLQVVAAALVSECKTYAHPASVDSIPTWADQEDHVSMGAFAARKAMSVVELLERVISLEILCAAQGLEFRKPLRPARAVEAAVKVLRKTVPKLESDRFMEGDMERALELLQTGELLDAVSRVTGELR